MSTFHTLLEEKVEPV